MKVGSVFFGILAVLMLAGCGARPYVDVESKDYATLQLVPHSETMIFTDFYYAYIDDYSKGCKNEVELGVVKTDSDTPSRVVKLPVDKPLLITAVYRVRTFDSSQITDASSFILTPEKDKHYIVSYFRKDISFFETMHDFDVYMQEGDKKVDVPASRLRSFQKIEECSEARLTKK